MFCELKLLQCSYKCNCLVHAITCRDLQYDNSRFHLSCSYLAVSIFKSKISTLYFYKPGVKYISYMQLPGNSLTSICPVHYLNYLILLDVGHNYIKYIKQNCFSASKQLKNICLNNNQIINLGKNAFHNLHHLRFLNLSCNPFSDLPATCFSYLLALQVLNLNNIKFTHVQRNSFFSTNVKFIKTSDYKITCVNPVTSFCTSYPPWFVSCPDILPSMSIKTMYINISLLTIGLNILSILLHVLKLHKRISQTIPVIVIGQNFSDSLCGIYLTIIWVSDILLKGFYLVDEHLWKSHPLCFTGLCTVLWFTMSSQMMMLFYFSMSRLIIYQVTSIHVFSFFTSLVLTLVFHFIEMQLPTSLCLPFIDPSGSSIITKVISWVVIISQSIFSVLIVGMHIVLVVEVNKLEKSVKKKSNSTKKLMSQLILISTSNILCWFPTNAIYLSAMYLSTYPTNLVIWTNVIIMPINTVINPCVFLLTNMKDIFKMITHEKGNDFF